MFKFSVIIAATIAAAIGPASAQQPAEPKAEPKAAAASDTGQSAAPAGARVYIINLKNGDTVTSPFKVQFGLTSNMGVAPAGIDKENVGHHHLLIDTTLTPEEMTQPVVSDEKHMHFGKGQTETTVTLPPGKHTLQLVLANWTHIPFNPPVQSEVITITVKDAAAAKPVAAAEPKAEPKAESKPAPKEAAKDVAKGAPVQVAQNVKKEEAAPKETSKETSKQTAKETSKEAPKEASKDVKKDAPKEAAKDVKTEAPKEAKKDREAKEAEVTHRHHHHRRHYRHHRHHHQEQYMHT
jgi:Domain of unknown function (DUF4399)